MPRPETVVLQRAPVVARASDNKRRRRRRAAAATLSSIFVGFAVARLNAPPPPMPRRNVVVNGGGIAVAPAPAPVGGEGQLRDYSSANATVGTVDDSVERGGGGVGAGTVSPGRGDDRDGDNAASPADGDGAASLDEGVGEEEGRKSTAVEPDAEGISGRNATATGLPLRPPFRLIQAGPWRTGSTFQHNLLLAIATLKSPNTTRILDTMSFDEDFVTRQVRNGESFVAKTHRTLDFFEDLQAKGDIAVFSSGGIVQYSLYNQNRTRLEQCADCEIDGYRDIFGLTDEDVRTLKEHMRHYGTLRQCCGHQMSKFEYYRLHGCDIRNFTSQPGHPGCEERNITEAEVRFSESPIRVRERKKGQYDWKKPGDCTRLNAWLMSPKGRYLGKDFPGCDKFAAKLSGV